MWHVGQLSREGTASASASVKAMAIDSSPSENIYLLGRYKGTLDVGPSLSLPSSTKEASFLMKIPTIGQLGAP